MSKPIVNGFDFGFIFFVVQLNLKEDYIMEKIKNIIKKFVESLHWLAEHWIMLLFSGVCSFLGIMACLEGYIYDEPEADILNQSMSVKYLSEIADREDKYPMFNDDVNDDKKYIFTDYCATQIVVSNDYDHAILLNKIIFEAEEISVNDIPKFLIQCTANDEGAVLVVTNLGWGDAKDVNIKLSCKDEDLGNYIDEKKHMVSVGCVKVGERVEVPLWKNEDILDTSSDVVLYLCAVSSDVNNEVIPVEYLFNGNGTYLIIENGRFYRPEMGAGSESIYGIKINTDEETYSCEFNISESIEAKNRLEMPICFFPDKSCSFKFRVTFEVIYNSNNQKKDISTDWAYLEFEVPSTGANAVFDAEEFDVNELEDSLITSPGMVKVTYPCADPDLMEYVESQFQ